MTDPAGRVYGFRYDMLGRPRAIQYPNATFAWTDYNPNGLISALYNRHGTLADPLPASVPNDLLPVADYSYVYDLDGKRQLRLPRFR